MLILQDLEYKCLIRATDGKKKIMTMVCSQLRPAFQGHFL